MYKKSQLLDLLRTNQNCKKQVDFINHFSQSKKLLELGANSDKLLIDLSKQKFDVSAIPSSVERTIFSKRKSVKIKKGRLQHIYGKEKYDIITVFNFNSQRFKNYWELENMLRTCSKRIETNGFLIIDFLRPQKLNSNEEFFLEENHSIKIVKCNKKSRRVRIKHKFLFNESLNQECNNILKSKTNVDFFEFEENLKILSLKKLISIADIWNLDLVDICENFNISKQSCDISGCENKEQIIEEKLNNLGSNLQLIFKKREIHHHQKGEKREKKKVVTKRGKIKEVSTSSFIIIMVIVCVVSVLLGTKIGSYYVMNFLVKPDYSVYSEEALRDDPSKIKVNGKKPSEITPLNAFVYAESKMLQNGDWTCSKQGEVKNSFANQTIMGECSFIGNEVSQTSISLGFKNVATKTVISVGDNKLKFYNGNPNKEGEVQWQDPEEKLLQDYRNEWGVSPQNIFPYIVSSKTLSGSTDWSSQNNTYTATLNLTLVSSVILYVKQMEKLSGLGAPTFEYINLTFTLDDNYNFKSVSIEEKYVVSIGLSVTCTGILTYNFQSN